MAEFLDSKGIDTAIKQFEKCLQKKGLKIKIDPKRKEQPGLENLLFTIIEFFDRVYATVLSPYAKLVDLAKRIKAAITNPTQLAELIKKVNELLQDIQKALSNIIKFVIEKVAEPLKKYAIPLTIPVGPIKITLSDKTDKIKDPKERAAVKKYIKGSKDSQESAQKLVDQASKKVKDAKKMAADAQADAELVQKKAKEKIEAALADLGSVKQYLQKMIAENLKIPEWLQKQVTLLFTFIQTAIDFVLSGFKAAIDALKSPTKKLIELVIKLTTNPPKFFLDLLKKAIEPILISLAPKFTKVKGKISELKADVSRFLNEVFSLKSINLNKYKSAIFKAVAPFFALIACSLTFAITFLPVVIKSLIKF
jgi:hypothetical protein